MTLRNVLVFRDLAASVSLSLLLLPLSLLLLRFSSQVCHSCFRQQAELHRCAQCRFAHYCNRTCQTACWEEHKQECLAIRRLGEVPGDRVR